MLHIVSLCRTSSHCEMKIIDFGKKIARYSKWLIKCPQEPESESTATKNTKIEQFAKAHFENLCLMFCKNDYFLQ